LYRRIGSETLELIRYLSLFVGLVILAYLVMGAFLYLRQDSLVFPADTTPLASPDDLIDGARRVTLHTQDGLALSAYYRPPVGQGPVIMYLHGNAGTIASRARRLALMAQGNTGLLAVEYRGYGDNPGKPGEAGLMMDAAAGMAFLREQGIEPRQIILYGESLGTNVALRTALAFPAAGLVLDAPYTSIVDVAASRYPYMPVRLLLRSRFDTLGRIPALKMPLLVMRTLQDHTVPPAQSLAVFEAAPEPKQIWTTQQGSHSTLIESGGLAVLQRFIGRVCPAEP